MNRYRITDAEGNTLCIVTAKGHVQHHYASGELFGVSKAAEAKLHALPDGPNYYSHDGNGTAQNIKLAGFWTGEPK